MKLVNPIESIDTIISVIENAKEFVVLVSPYTDLNGWENLKNAINNASAKGVKIHYYVRKEEGVPGTEELNVTLFEVPDLHSKMFYSEDSAVIGSAHLKYNEDINWTYILDKPTEYDEMKDFFEKNIKPVAIEKN
jgi:phosphatidylserine/phosphatidylglycerophosphate/cardiolipin synthase-like enzyme